MKSLALLFVTLSSAYGARLDNTYIPPPPSAAYAGGQGLVQAPKQGPSQQQYGFSQQPRPSSGTFRQAQPQYQSGPSSYQPQAGPSSYQPPSQPQYQGRNNYQQPSGPPIPILKFVNNPNGGDGAYNFEYLTGNGISHEERGYNKPLGPELGEQVVEGSYSYTADDGQQITVTYTADANGFHAQGDHLPTPPPIPDEIAESLKLTAPGYNPYDYASTGPARSATFPQNNQPSYSQNGYGQQPGNYGAAPKTAYNPQGQQGYNQPQPQPQYSSHSSQSAYSSRGPARPSNAYIPPPSYRK